MNRPPNPKKGYKKIHWMFDREIKIPEEWTITRTSEILKVTMGQSPPSESYNEEEKGLPFYQGVTDFGAAYPNPTVWCTDSKKIAESNSILFSVRAPVGETNLTKTRCCIGRGIASFNTRKNNLLYCFYLISKNKKNFSVYAQGTTYDAINREDIEKTKLPFTDNIKEQAKIASILSGVDALIESTQEAIEKTERLKKGLMQRLLTRGIGHTKFKKVHWMFSKDIKIPEEWDAKRLSDVGDIIGGGTPDSKNPEYWNGDILWAIPTDITKLQTNEIKNTERKITKHGLDNSSAKLLPKGAILITSRATIGECAIAAKPISTNQGFQSIICNDGFDKLLIFYLLRHNQNNLLRLSYGTTFLEISKKGISKVVVTVPASLPEQQRIASILSGVDAYIQKNQEYKEKLEILKKGLMQNLLTGKIRVKI